MPNKERNSRSAEIIKWYFDNNNTEERSDELFAQWIDCDENEAEKDAALFEIFKQEMMSDGENMITLTPEQEDRFAELLKKYNATADTREPEKIAPKERSFNRLTFAQKALRVAAAIIPLAIISGVWILSQKQATDDVYTNQWDVPLGASENITLPEGSKIDIKEGSSLNVRQEESRRMASLNGEAYFRIAKDENRKFIVSANELTVTVLGTEFNVESYPNKHYSTVTLDKGKVHVMVKDKGEYELAPGQQLIHDKNTHEVKIVNLNEKEEEPIVEEDVKPIQHTIEKKEDRAEWKNDNLICNGMNLHAILKALKSEFGIDYIVEDGVILPNGALRVEFRKTDKPETIAWLLDDIALPQELGCKFEDNKIKIFEKLPRNSRPIV